jgi:D-alanine-D-alanine ligase
MIKPYFDSKIGVLCGGFSREREVSLRSGQAVYDALIRQGYNAHKVDPALHDLAETGCTLFFNVLHGQFGEDGSVQAYLEHLGIPYTGSGVRSLVITMNKYLTKLALIRAGIPTPSFVLATQAYRPLAAEIDYPVIIKPICEGSSLGVEIVDNASQFDDVLSRALTQYGSCLIEQFIAGKEVSIGVLEKEGEPIALPILELRPKNRFYDFEAKYTEGKTDFIIPAELSPEVTLTAQGYAIRSHSVTECCGVSRIDMMVHPTEGPYVLEVNGIPGMTTLSDLPAQAKAYGLSFDELVLLILGSTRHQARGV